MVDLICCRELAHLQPVHLLLLVVTTAADTMRTAVHRRVDRTGVLQLALRRRVAGAPVPDRHKPVGIGGGQRRKSKPSAQHRRSSPKKSSRQPEEEPQRNRQLCVRHLADGTFNCTGRHHPPEPPWEPPSAMQLELQIRQISRAPAEPTK